MINSQEIKIGTCIRMDGKVWVCIDFQHRKPGKGNTVMNTKLKNVADGRVLERTFQVGFKLEDVRVERRPYQYLYEDATGCIFMNQETFEQVPIAKENVTGGQYMKEGDVVEVVTDTTDGTILLAEMPAVALERLAEMGEWMKTYGETIYGTRGGIVAPHDWGVTTQKGNRLFVHILNLKDKSLFLPLGNQKVKKAFDFASKKPVKVQKCEGGVLLNLGEVPTEMDKVVEIAL